MRITRPVDWQQPEARINLLEEFIDGLNMRRRDLGKHGDATERDALVQETLHVPKDKWLRRPSGDIHSLVAEQIERHADVPDSTALQEPENSRVKHGEVCLDGVSER